MRTIKCKILSLMIILCFILFITACAAEDRFPDYESGDQITLTTENVEKFVAFKKNKLNFIRDQNYYLGIEYKYTCNGFYELSYFNVEITLRMTYKVLNELGVYQDVVVEKVLKLDKLGNSSIKDTHQTGMEYRNMKDLNFSILNVKGYVVKK